MTEDETQRMDEDPTERIDDEALALTQRLSARPPAVTGDQAPQTAEERTQAISRRQIRSNAEDLTEAIPDKRIRSILGGHAEPVAGGPADETQRIADEQTQVVKREPASRTPAPQPQRASAEQTQPMGAEQTQRMDDEQTERFTGAGGGPDDAETYVHFGPGVPATIAPDRATAIWRGVADQGDMAGTATAATVRTPRSGRQRWILPLTVLILVVAVVAYFLFGRSTPAMSVTGVSVRTSAATVGCSGQETLTGVIATDGGAGAVSYQWVRSDGTKSGVLRQAVDSGDKLVDVTLVWNFEGVGSLHATAVLDILGPGTARSASASFAYSCSG